MSEPKKHVDPYIHQKLYAQNLKNSGLVRVTLWIPGDQRAHILEYGKGLREEVR